VDRAKEHLRETIKLHIPTKINRRILHDDNDKKHNNSDAHTPDHYLGNNTTLQCIGGCGEYDLFPEGYRFDALKFFSN
jgi:hypothetical protein